MNFLLTLVLAWMAALKYPFLHGKFLRKLIKRRTITADQFNVGQGYTYTCLDRYHSLKASNPFQQDILAERLMNAFTHNDSKLTPQKSHYLYEKLLQCFSQDKKAVTTVDGDHDVQRTDCEFCLTVPTDLL